MFPVVTDVEPMFDATEFVEETAGLREGEVDDDTG